MIGWILLLLVLVALALFIWELVQAPTVDESNCPIGEKNCGGPCVENPPCMNDRGPPQQFP